MQIHSCSSFFYHIINSNSIQQNKALQNLLFYILTMLFLLPESVQHMDFCVNGKGFASSYRRSIDTKIHMLFSASKQKRIIMNTRFISLIFQKPSNCTTVYFTCLRQIQCQSTLKQFPDASGTNNYHIFRQYGVYTINFSTTFLLKA